MSFTCPLCHQPLTQINNSVICPQRHQFDVAKEGYINLLPVQHKRSRDPGDSAEMMQARRAFLDAGHYQPLRDAVINLLRERLDQSATAILDIGCGEGYYTHAFAEALPGVTTFGLDVAKTAIKAAAKRYSQVKFCVASSHRLPFADASMDAVIRIYAPCKAQELARVVKPCGHLRSVAGYVVINKDGDQPNEDNAVYATAAEQGYRKQSGAIATGHDELIVESVSQ